MTNSNSTTVVPRAPRKPLTGTVEAVNEGGIKIEGAWYNYGRIFKGTRLTQSAIGAIVALTLVQSMDKKFFVASIESVENAKDDQAPAAEAPEAEFPEKADPAADKSPREAEVASTEPSNEEPAPSEEPPAEPPASDKQRDYARDLASNLKLSPEKVDLIMVARFGKTFDNVSKAEMKLVIPFFGGPDRTAGRRQFRTS